MNRNVCSLVCFAALLCVSAHCRAQALATDDPQRINEGLRAFKSRDYELAASLLSEGLSRHPWPTVAYYAGLAYEKLGRLVEAAELYRRAALLAPHGTGEDLELDKKAKNDAANDLTALEPRIAKLFLRIEAAQPDAVTVTLDGASVAVASLSAPLFLYPGSHRVEATAECGDKDASHSRSVTLAKGQRDELALNLQCPDQQPPPPSLSPASGAAPPPRPLPVTPVPDTEPPRTPLWRTLGWVGIGVGGAGVVLSAVTAAAGESIRARACDDDNTCDPDKADDVDTYESLQTWSTVGFWVGFPVLAAGVGALLWDKHQEDHGPQAQGVTPWVGLGSVGLRGRFQ